MKRLVMANDITNMFNEINNAISSDGFLNVDINKTKDAIYVYISISKPKIFDEFIVSGASKFIDIDYNIHIKDFTAKLEEVIFHIAEFYGYTIVKDGLENNKVYFQLINEKINS